MDVVITALGEFIWAASYVKKQNLRASHCFVPFQLRCGQLLPQFGPQRARCLHLVPVCHTHVSLLQIFDARTADGV